MSFPPLTPEQAAIVALGVAAGIVEQQPQQIASDQIEIIDRMLTIFKSINERGITKNIGPITSSVGALSDVYLQNTWQIFEKFSNDPPKLSTDEMSQNAQKALFFPFLFDFGNKTTLRTNVTPVFFGTGPTSRHFKLPNSEKFYHVPEQNTLSVYHSGVRLRYLTQFTVEESGGVGTGFNSFTLDNSIPLSGTVELILDYFKVS